ncbi:hypothetical protein T492DRAFT_108743 [Pavlovales sp. CCMP2436]|nr:hypothetical protein T492DRAFT_108743 [Pavlovales sp. CCMP2436]
MIKGSRPFVCGEEGCEYKATRVSHLKRHKLTHSRAATAADNDAMAAGMLPTALPLLPMGLAAATLSDIAQMAPGAVVVGIAQMGTGAVMGSGELVVGTFVRVCVFVWHADGSPLARTLGELHHGCAAGREQSRRSRLRDAHGPAAGCAGAVPRWRPGFHGAAGATAGIVIKKTSNNNDDDIINNIYNSRKNASNNANHNTVLTFLIRRSRLPRIVLILLTLL